MWFLRFRRFFKSAGKEALMLAWAFRHPATPRFVKVGTMLLVDDMQLIDDGDSDVILHDNGNVELVDLIGDHLNNLDHVHAMTEWDLWGSHVG